MSSEEREDEEGEVRRGSEAEGSRFNVGVMAIVRGNSFYMNIFGLCWYRVSCVVADVYIYTGKVQLVRRAYRSQM
jgi:hypothetical protein